MTERDAAIIDLTKQGLSAHKVRDRLGLSCSVRQVQRVARKAVQTGSAANSTLYQFPLMMRDYIEWCLEQRGLDEHVCGICGERQAKKCDIHHTKYEGATVYDLMYVCRSCNCARVNCGLA